MTGATCLKYLPPLYESERQFGADACAIGNTDTAPPLLGRQDHTQTKRYSLFLQPIFEKIMLSPCRRTCYHQELVSVIAWCVKRIYDT